MAHASPARGVARRGSDPGPPKLGGRYGVLLLVLITTYVLSAFSLSRLAGDLQVVLFAAVLLLALRTSRVRRRTVMLAGAPTKLDDFEDLIRGYGIVEMQRTGRVALPMLDRADHRGRPASGTADTTEKAG